MIYINDFYPRIFPQFKLFGTGHEGGGHKVESDDILCATKLEEVRGGWVMMEKPGRNFRRF